MMNVSSRMNTFCGIFFIISSYFMFCHELLCVSFGNLDSAGDVFDKIIISRIFVADVIDCGFSES